MHILQKRKPARKEVERDLWWLLQHLGSLISNAKVQLPAQPPTLGEAERDRTKHCDHFSAPTADKSTFLPSWLKMQNPHTKNIRAAGVKEWFHNLQHDADSQGRCWHPTPRASSPAQAQSQMPCPIFNLIQTPSTNKGPARSFDFWRKIVSVESRILKQMKRSTNYFTSRFGK